MNILALDCATKCGWAHTDGPSGVWDFSVRKDESGGMRLIRFRAKLREFTDLDVIVFEASRNMKFGNAVRVAAQLQGVIELHCVENNIDYRGYSPKEAKKFATGKGNASKEMMLESARERWGGLEIIDDNHADALWLLELAKRDMGEPLTPESH